MSKIIWLVQREEMTDDSFDVYPEKVFLIESSAKAYCMELDPTGKGFEYVCPCCGEDKHYRSYSVTTIVLEEG